MKEEQINLFESEEQSKKIIHVPTDTLTISPFNPRKTRPDEYIERLAERINNNGYEITRAMWAYATEGGYEVFAGGTRLKASQRAGVKEVPIVLHKGFTEEEIVALSEADNENDEYHAPVPVVDMWQSYKELSDMGWTQEKIAEAKGCSQNFVSYRINLAKLPESILEIIRTEFINEGSATELLKLSDSDNPPWLTYEEALHYVIEESLKKPIAKTFKKHVGELNDAIELVEKELEALPRNRLLGLLAENESRTPYEVQVDIDTLTSQTAKEKREEAKKAESEAAEAERKAKEAEHRILIESMEQGQWWKLGRHYLYCGDTSEDDFVDMLPNVPLVFADPPYNANAAEWDNNFSWKHDWLTDKAEIAAVTPGISSIVDFACTTRMNYKWSLACWITNGMTRGALGFGNWIYTALFSNKESIHKTEQDFMKTEIDASETDETKFKGRKPAGYMKGVIDLFTDPGDWVIDPFGGSGTTLLVCEKNKRKCITGELEPEFCKGIVHRWEELTGEKAERYEQDRL